MFCVFVRLRGQISHKFCLSIHYTVLHTIRVSLTMQHILMSAKPDGIVEVYSKEVAFIFDKHKILNIEVSV